MKLQKKSAAECESAAQPMSSKTYNKNNNVCEVNNQDILAKNYNKIQSNVTGSAGPGGRVGALDVGLFNQTRPLVSRRVNSQNNKCVVGNCHREEMQTPSGYVGIDWIRGTIGYTFIRQLASYLSDFLDSDYVEYDYGKDRYNRQISFECYGIQIYFDSNIERSVKLHGGKALLNITGTALSFFSAEGLMKLIKDLWEMFLFDSSRLDPFFDDESRRISPIEVCKIAKEGNVTGFRKCKYVEGCFKIGKPDEVDGSGTYFGSRGKNGCGKYLRVYDKELESKGEIKAIRWEPELSGEIASQAFIHLYKSARTGDIKRFTSAVGGLVAGCITFIDRTSKPREKNISRFEVLQFWKEIVEEIGEVKLRNPRKVSTIETSVAWVEKSVAAPLVKIRVALGDEQFYSWLFEQMDEKQKQITLKQRIEIEAFWKSQAEYDNIPI